jgi:hypothetical protein
MRFLFTIPLLICAAIFLCGCPYSSAYKLDEQPVNAIDESIIGKWAVFVKKPGKGREEPVKMSISKNNDQEYAISFTGYIDEIKPYIIFADDSIKGTATLSTAVNKNFLNIFVKDRTYLVEYKLENGKLSFFPLSDHFTSKLIRSSAALRVALEFHYKTRLQPMYDEDFCLKDMMRVN